ncbi:MAG: class I SAM-dependent methyltransferase [Cyanobacteria bacterium P01_A01_bin.135]
MVVRWLRALQPLVAWSNGVAWANRAGGARVCLAGIVAAIALFGIASPALADSPANVYDYSYRRPSADGIGKVYLGREISQVMGHRGAAWLERPSRQQREQPQVLVSALNLEPEMVVADVGAGTGYFTFRMAPQVPAGKILAVDIQPEMLEIVEFLKTETQVTNVETVLASETDPHLPGGIDLVLLVDAYHEFAYPYEVMMAIAAALKPGGRVVLAEYRAENPLIPIKRHHKMSQRQVRREMAAVGLRWVSTNEDLPTQHLLTFEKPVALP